MIDVPVVQAEIKKVITKEELEKQLANIQIRKEDVNKLVMNYIVTEGYPGATEKFGQESGTTPEIDPMTISERLLIRENILEGKIDEAIEIINDLNPELLDTNSLLFFHLQLQKYIKFIREKEYEKALKFAREEIAPIGEANPSFIDELEETFALFGFDKPEESPLKELLDQAQRNKRANEVNAAILTSQYREPEPKLETLLKKLIWAENKLEGMTVFPHVHNDLSMPL